MPTNFQKARRRLRLGENQWSDPISYATSSESVEMTDGTDLQTKIDDIDDDLVSEVNRATNAESTLDDKIATEKSRAEGAEQTIAENLTTHDNNTTKHITSTERTNWNDANSKKHEHSNKSVLDATTASYTTDEQTKLSGIESGAQVNTVTGVKGDSESGYRIGNINITKGNIGLGNVDNTSDANKPISTATQTALDNKVDKVTGKGLSTEDYTTTEKTKLSGIATGAEVNQNAFSNVKVGESTVTADSKTDTLEIVAGSNVTITPDTTNDKITISSKDTVYTHPNSGVTTGTYKSVTVDAKGHVTNGFNPTTLAGYGITDAATSTQGGKADTAVQSVKIGTSSTEYKSGTIVTLPAYPTTLPASDVSAWAKASTKPNYTASEVGAIASTLKGAKNGVAELDSNGKVPSSQLPSYVDDVIEGYLYNGKFYKESAHTTEITGETGKIYIDLSTNKEYRWSGSAFSVISDTIALGETSSTAYRGDRGKTAYDHSQSTHARTDATAVTVSSTNGNIKINGTETTVYTHPGSGTNPHGTTKSDVGLGNVGNFKAVSTVASQGLTDTEKSNARANIGAGTSSFSGSYNDLSNKPTIPTVPNGFSRVTVGSTNIDADTTTDTLTLVAGSNITLTPDATNDKVTITASQPTVNNGTLTIQKNGTNVQTFTANQSSNATANITVPTKVSELSNDSGYTTNVGTVTQVEVGTTVYNPSSGVISLPAYPTSLPASDVYAWAKASTKPTYTASEVGAAASSHTHGLSLATDSGTSSISLAANTKYKLTAGGSTYVFTTPPDSDTTYSSKTAASGGTDVSLVTTGEKYTWNNKSNLAIGTTATTAAAGNHTHTTSIATSTGTNQLTLAFGTKYALTAGGTSYIFTMPSNPNTNTTYTVSTGDSNGQIKVTPSSGSAYNVNIKGLGSAAYTASTAYAAASHSHNYAGSSSAGGAATTLAGTYSGSGGQLTPSAVTSGTVRAAMMNNPKGLTGFPTYADCILMDAYTGSDVPWTTGLGIVKQDASPRMFIFNGAKGNTTTWKNITEVVTAGNFTSQALTKSQVTTALGYTPPTTNTTYSEATSSAYGLVKIGYTASGKNYPVQLSNGQMYVNVPWTDTNTWPTKTSQLTNDSGFLTSHQTVSNKGVTLAWSTTSTIATIGGTDIKVTMPANPNTNTDTNVTQTATSTNANYEVLFSATADNTTRTEGARKYSNFLFNPSTGNLQVTQLNGVTIGSSPKFTDTNTWRPIGTGATDAAAGNHTHTTSIATSTGTNQLTLAFGTKYALTAGGTSYVFTMPSNPNTDTKVTQTATTTNAFYPILFGNTASSKNTVTDSARKDGDMTFYYNPSNKTMYLDRGVYTTTLEPGDITVESSDSDTYVSMSHNDLIVNNTWDGTNISLKNAISALNSNFIPTSITDTLLQTANTSNIAFYKYGANATNNPVSGFEGVIISIPVSSNISVRYLISTSSRIFTSVYSAGVSWGSWAEH